MLQHAATSIRLNGLFASASTLITGWLLKDRFWLLLLYLATLASRLVLKIWLRLLLV